MAVKFVALRFALSLLTVLVCSLTARAHEAYLLLTANADGTVAVETGFSDGSSSAGLKLLVRDSATSQTLAEHVLPEGGKFTLTPPATAYRVTFDGGPGHRVSKSGPLREVPAATPATPAVVATAAVPTAPEVVPVAPPSPPETSHTLRLALVVGIFFLFGTLSFGLGYAAGRRTN